MNPIMISPQAFDDFQIRVFDYLLSHLTLTGERREEAKVNYAFIKDNEAKLSQL